MTDEEITIQYLMTEFNNFKARCAELEKENAELNRDKTELVNSVTELENKVTELEKQIDQLSNDNHVLKTAFITQKEQIEKARLEGDENLWIVSHQLEELLKIAKDKGVIKSWYTNGTYHWELTE